MASHREAAHSSAYEALGSNNSYNAPGPGDPEGECDLIMCEGKRLQMLNTSLTDRNNDIVNKLSSMDDREARQVLAVLNVDFKQQNSALSTYLSRLLSQNHSLREMLKKSEDGRAAINMQKAAELLVKALANAEEEVQGLKVTLKEVKTQRDKYKDGLAKVNAELKSSDAHAHMRSMAPPQGGMDIMNVSPTKFPSTPGLRRGSGAHAPTAVAGRHPHMMVDGGGVSNISTISPHNPQTSLAAGLQGRVQLPSRRSEGGAAGCVRPSTGVVGGSSEAHGSRHSGSGIVLASSSAPPIYGSTAGMSDIPPMWDGGGALRVAPDIFGVTSSNHTDPGASGIARSGQEVFGSTGLKCIDEDMLNWAVEESKGAGSKDATQVGLPSLTGAYDSDDEPSMFF